MSPEFPLMLLKVDMGYKPATLSESASPPHNIEQSLVIRSD
ncbi:hypothetical protein LT85_3181 [Collimonas arenae]|uniref:Uncharacterized protein n=1 Tax=Collimonas arenae TaxID=279058 RepID=A0A0A1FFB5_9BURK|nr:hypothetical protein LT85_3181 [Collimonas arenae]